MKRIFKILSLLALITLAAFLLFYPVKVQKTVSVPYTMYKSGEQFINAKNLVKWFSPFTPADTSAIIKTRISQSVSSGSTNVEISDITMFSSILKLKDGSKVQRFRYTSLADSIEVIASNITLTHYTTPFRKWFAKNKLEKRAEENLENLKDFMIDTRRFYGYEIQEVAVQDTAFLFKRETVPLSEKKAATKRIFESLIKYGEEHNAGYNGTRIFYTLKSGTEITIFASIGITNMIEPTPSSGIEYKRMPFGKNLIVANYQGPFGQSEKGFKALETFKKDHNLSSMAIPYQKFMSDGYDFADDQVVQLKIYYPVF